MAGTETPSLNTRKYLAPSKWHSKVKFLDVPGHNLESSKT